MSVWLNGFRETRSQISIQAEEGDYRSELWRCLQAKLFAAPHTTDGNANLSVISSQSKLHKQYIMTCKKRLQPLMPSIITDQTLCDAGFLAWREEIWVQRPCEFRVVACSTVF